MRKNLAMILLLVVLVSSVLSGCGNGNSNGEISENTTVTTNENTDNEEVQTTSEEKAPIVDETLLIQNFNKEREYKKNPEKVVCLSFNTLEILAKLGITEHVVLANLGYNSIDDMLDECKDSASKIPLTNAASLDELLKIQPDLIILESYTFFAKEFGTEDDYQKNNIPLYVTEGSYAQNPTMDTVYHDIENLGKMFSVEEQSAKLIEQMKLDISEVQDKVKGLEKVSVLHYDSGEDIPMIGGGTGFSNLLIELAGGLNVFDDIEQPWSPSSWEEFITRNPEVIIVTAYSGVEDANKKIEFLKSKPELSGVSAIKNDRFVVVPLMRFFPGIQNSLAVEDIAKSIHPDQFN